MIDIFLMLLIQRLYMKIIAVLNYKGGVGKTTFTVSISQALALAGFRVLAIDNDGQHNLSLLLGEKTFKPNIKDIYRSSLGNAGKKLMHSIRETGVHNLHLITSESELCSAEVKDPFILQKTILYCALYRYYDFIIIDNPPGIDILQEVAIHAADEIFMPTELSYFAVNGIREMHRMISERFCNECPITKIIPNFYRNTKQQNEYLRTIRQQFPSKLSKIAIPYDPVFDECMREGKILFLHRLYSKGAAYYMKIIHDLFNLDEEKIWDQVMKKRKETLSIEARIRYFEQREIVKKKTRQIPAQKSDQVSPKGVLDIQTENVEKEKSLL